MARESAPVPVVELVNLSVRYGRAHALRDVTTSFEAGAVGLLGPNGAGKSTLIKALLGFVHPDGGGIRVLGADVRSAPLAARARIGYMPEHDAHIPGMTAVAFVAYCGELAGLPRSDAMQRSHEVLHYVGLSDVRYRTIDTYATGMKQRVKLAQALVHDPDLLLLDEPTNGMDPQGRDEMLQLIRDITHDKGLNLILSSHLLPDVEYACDHVVVLDQGHMVMQGPIDALKGQVSLVFELRVKGETTPFIAALRAEGIECQGAEEDVMRLFVPEGHTAQQLFQLAVEHGVQVRHFRSSAPTLDDVFARAVGETP
jgi:ABC-2 type transport system ATP-binding protein